MTADGKFVVMQAQEYVLGLHTSVSVILQPPLYKPHLLSLWQLTHGLFIHLPVPETCRRDFQKAVSTTGPAAVNQSVCFALATMPH